MDPGDRSSDNGGGGISGVTKTAIHAMRDQPLSLALLLVNCIFLGFSAYLLKEVSENSKERNKSQTEMIQTLLRNCRQVGT